MASVNRLTLVELIETEQAKLSADALKLWEELDASLYRNPEDEPAFIKGRAIRLSIFMNVFNVHVNRYPVDGAVSYVHYNKGKFFNAAAEKSSLENEQMSVGIDSGKYHVLVRQIAGLIARRIVTYSKVGDKIKQGDRMGIIRFGSRVDVFLPPGTKVRAKLGDATVAGVTILGDLP